LVTRNRDETRLRDPPARPCSWMSWALECRKRTSAAKN
jgi:hypothetical protein